MLALLGVHYLTDSILAAKIRIQTEENYRIYVTECLYTLCAFAGNPMQYRYYDLVHPKPVDNRSGDEIAIDRLKGLGIEVVD